MARPKGLPKTGGRAKGSPNHTTTEMREFITSLLDKNRQQLTADFAQLDPVDKWRITEKLFAYIIPRQKTVDANISFDAMTDGQLDLIVSELIANTQEDEDTNQ